MVLITILIIPHTLLPTLRQTPDLTLSMALSYTVHALKHPYSSISLETPEPRVSFSPEILHVLSPVSGQDLTRKGWNCP